MLGRRPKSLVGLDIGSSVVKAVELRQSGAGYKVVAVGAQPMPLDSIVGGVIMDGGIFESERSSSDNRGSWATSHTTPGMAVQKRVGTGKY